MIRNARCTFEENMVKNMKQEPLQLHRYIRSQRKVTACVGQLENGRGELTRNDQETAEVLGAFFSVGVC